MADTEDPTALMGLDPDHPLLQKAQQALKEQLLENKQRVEGELREKGNLLKAAKQRREDVGVELYGFQQNLAKLQLQLEQTQQNYETISEIRLQAEQELNALRKSLEQQENITKQERTKVSAQQAELDKLGLTLRQIEQQNEEMKSEIEATKRAAYAAEEAVSRLEKEKMEQDLLVDSLQDTLKRLTAQLEMFDAQLEAQKLETRAAQELLAQAETEMETVHFEKKQLVARWKSSLNAVARRDEALLAVQTALREQREQELAITAEISGYKADIAKEQLRNEQLTSVLRRAEGEAQYLKRQIEGYVERQEKLQMQLMELTRSLEATETQLKAEVLQAKRLQTEREGLERVSAKVGSDIRAVEEQVVLLLGEQTTAEKSGSKAAGDIRALRKRMREEELTIAGTQNELAKLQVDILNTDAHNERLAEALALLDAELTEKSSLIERCEADIRRRTDEIERKTREIDGLNRKYEKMTANVEDVNTGPLEATISSLQREIDSKGQQGLELQRRWIQHQGELVTLQNDNAALTEDVARLKAEHTVVTQKKRRLEQQCEQQKAEIKRLNVGMGQLRTDLQRINSLIASNTNLKALLQEESFNLESKIVAEVRELEQQAAQLACQIETQQQQRREVLAEIMEVERQIMLWERKIQLEHEMQEALDPSVGNDVVGAMRKEIHRMQMRHADLLRLQEKLMQELEKAISRRQLINVRSAALKQKKATAAGEAEAAAKKSLQDLQRNIRDAERQVTATDQHIQHMQQQRTALSAALMELDARCKSVAKQQEQVRMILEGSGMDKYRLLLATSRQQRNAKRYEDAEGGRLKPSSIPASSSLAAELQRAHDKQGHVVALLQQLQLSLPHLGNELDRVLSHVAVA